MKAAKEYLEHYIERAEDVFWKKRFLQVKLIQCQVNNFNQVDSGASQLLTRIK